MVQTIQHQQANGATLPLPTNVGKWTILIQNRRPFHATWKLMILTRKDRHWYFFSHISATMSYSFQGQNDFLGQFLELEKEYLKHLLNLEMPPTNRSCTAC